jgi:hypothetical protein
MATVVRFPQPILELSLEAGGSLSPNTTYYFTGAYYRVGGIEGYYSAFTSKAASEVSITTDTTNLSIRIRVKWDTGSGFSYSYPTYAAAFLVKYDNVSLMSGGKFISTWENSMLIQTGLNYLMTANKTKGNNYLFWHPEFHDYQNRLQYSMFDLDKGTCMLIIDSSGDSWSTIQTAVNGVSDKVCRYAYTLEILGDIYFKNAVALYGGVINIFCGSFVVDTGIVPIFNQTIINYGGTGYTYALGKMYGAFVFSEGWRNSNSLDCINESINTIYRIGNTAIYGQVINDKTINYGQIGSVYPNIHAVSKNMTLFNSVVIMQAPSAYGQGAGYIRFENYKRYTHTATEVQHWAYLRDIHVYTVTDPDLLGYIWLDFYLETDRPTADGINYVAENKPKILWNGGAGVHISHPIFFDYTAGITIEDKDGVPIPNAAVSLINEVSSVEYSGVTDNNGFISFQVRSREARMRADYYDTNLTDWIDKPDFVITVHKSGYQDYVGSVRILNKIDWEIALIEEIPPVPPIYVTEGLAGNVESEVLEAEMVETNIGGQLGMIGLSGAVSEIEMHE